MNSQVGKDVGNDRSECNNVYPTQPQQSTSKVSSTTLSEDTEATQVSGSKGVITGKKLKFQPHWQKKLSWINYNSVTNGMLCQYCSYIYKEDREVKKSLRIMYFLCKQKIAHFSNFDEVVQLMVENGDDEVRKHLDTAPRNAHYGSHVAISEYLDAISLWVKQGILRSLKEAAFYSILADKSTDIETIEELSICFRWVDSSGSPVEHFLGLLSLSACDAASIYLLH